MIMVQNMKTGSPALQHRELLAEVALTSWWRSTKIPTWTSSSAWTSSKAIDFQLLMKPPWGTARSFERNNCSVDAWMTGELTAIR